MFDISSWLRPFSVAAVAGGILVAAIPLGASAQTQPTEIARWPHGAAAASIAWDEISGHLYVADIATQKILKFTPSGTLVGGIDFPSAASFVSLAVDDQGSVYAAMALTIEKWNAAGDHVLGWTPGGGSTDYLSGLCVLGGNEIITFVEGPDALRRFKHDGALVDSWTVGVASDLAAAGGRVYFIDDFEWDARVESNAVTSGGWGDYRSFALPDDAGAVALATNAAGTLFVADNASHVLQYDASATLTNRWNTAMNPEAIAASGNGRVFVLEGENIAVYSFQSTVARPMSLGAIKALYR